jgi:hypothetical protein
MRPGSFFRLLKFECRKSFYNPWILLFFALLLVLNGWKLRDCYSRKTAQWQDYAVQYAQTYDAYRGSITPEKVGKLMKTYGPLEEKYNAWALDHAYDPDAYTYSEAMDEEFYRTLFVAEMKYDYFYQNEAIHICAKANYLAQMHLQLGNVFEAAKNLRISEDFTGRRIPAFADTRGYEVLLEYDFSAMLVLLLSVFALCRVFVSEKESEMYMLLRTTRHGTVATVAAKLSAAVLFALVVCTVFFTQDFLVIYFSGGRSEALASPVYALRALESTHLRISLGTYFFYAAVMKTLGILGCIWVILLISALMKQTLGAFLAAIAALFLLTALQEFSSLWVLKWFNPIELLAFRELICKDQFVNVFSFPIRVSSFVSFGVIGVICMMHLAIIFCCRSYHIRRKRRRRHVTV